MITAKQFQALKKNNVSADSEKSSERILEAFKSASTEQKAELTKLSGLAKNTFYKGATSPKSVLALACVLKISPYYLIGENDDQNCSDDMIKEFYKKCVSGVNKKTETVKEKSAKTAKTAKAEPTPAPKKTEKKSTSVKTTAKPAVKKSAVKLVEVKTEHMATPAVNSAKAPKIDDESLVSLLRALSIRAKFGGEAEMTYNAVVALLIK